MDVTAAIMASGGVLGVASGYALSQRGQRDAREQAAAAREIQIEIEENRQQDAYITRIERDNARLRSDEERHQQTIDRLRVEVDRQREEVDRLRGQVDALRATGRDEVGHVDGRNGRDGARRRAPEGPERQAQD